MAGPEGARPRGTWAVRPHREKCSRRLTVTVERGSSRFLAINKGTFIGKPGTPSLLRLCSGPVDVGGGHLGQEELRKPG